MQSDSRQLSESDSLIKNYLLRWVHLHYYSVRFTKGARGIPGRRRSKIIQCCYLHFHYSFQRKELVKDFGVYIKFVDLEQCEQSSKQGGTGLMRHLISIFYSNE